MLGFTASIVIRNKLQTVHLKSAQYILCISLLKILLGVCHTQRQHGRVFFFTSVTKVCHSNHLLTENFTILETTK